MKKRNKITLADVAAYANVSKSAASKALLNGGGETTKISEKTAERIRLAAKELCFQPYAPARQLKTRKSKIVGAIIHNAAAEIFYKIFSHIETRLSKLDYCFMVGQSSGELKQIERYLNEFRSRGVDAIVCELHESPEQNSKLKDLYSENDNIVFVGASTFQNKYIVEPDIKTGVNMLVDYLVKSGRKKIAIDLNNIFFTSMRLRREGYIEALKRHGIEFQKNICLDRYESENHDEQIKQLAQTAIEDNVDAVIATNDLRAIKLLKELKKRNPGRANKIAVTGFDNFEIARLYDPGITTIDLQIGKMADACIEYILEIIEGKKEPRRIKIKPELIARESA